MLLNDRAKRFIARAETITGGAALTRITVDLDHDGDYRLWRMPRTRPRM
jgi:hypothetical protein